MFLNFDNSAFLFGKENTAENIIFNKNLKNYIIFYRLLFIDVIDVICTHLKYIYIITRDFIMLAYRFLALSDIALLVYTLECLYALTSLGERPCTSVARVRGAIDTLVALVTVEAQSYGPKACILMRVVETVSTVATQQNTAVQSSVAVTPATPASTTTSVSTPSTPATATAIVTAAPASPASSRPTTPAATSTKSTTHSM